MSVRKHYILLLTSINISSISGIIFIASYIYDIYYPVYFLFHISNTSKYSHIIPKYIVQYICTIFLNSPFIDTTNIYVIRVIFLTPGLAILIIL